MRIVVSGLVGLYPLGGVAWDYLQYAIGLHRMGHDVYYYEDTWSWPFNPLENRNVEDGEYSVQFIDAFFRAYEPALCSHWHYVHLHTKTFGMSQVDVSEVLRTADLFINISGANIVPDRLSASCIKVFIDTDPGYNQIVMMERFAWSENVDQWLESIRSHDVHFTYAENIWSPDCRVPRLDFAWKTTRMPIVISLWEDIAAQAASERAPWSTVMTWNAFKGKLVYEGIEYGSKGHEFQKIIDLPSQVLPAMLIAVGGIAPPLQRLRDAGWKVIDGPSATLTPTAYKELIAESRAEVSIAKNVYAALRTGWFSCRSACYLAAGRPVVVQDTGFSQFLPTGSGLHVFDNLAEAKNAIELVEGDYANQCQLAREFAVEFFGADRVLSSMLETIGQA